MRSKRRIIGDREGNLALKISPETLQQLATEQLHLHNG